MRSTAPATSLKLLPRELLPLQPQWCELLLELMHGLVVRVKARDRVGQAWCGAGARERVSERRV